MITINACEGCTSPFFCKRADVLTRTHLCALFVVARQLLFTSLYQMCRLTPHFCVLFVNAEVCKCEWVWVAKHETTVAHMSTIKSEFAYRFFEMKSGLWFYNCDHKNANH